MSAKKIRWHEEMDIEEKEDEEWESCRKINDLIAALGKEIKTKTDEMALKGLKENVERAKRDGVSLDKIDECVEHASTLIQLNVAPSTIIQTLNDSINKMPMKLSKLSSLPREKRLSELKTELENQYEDEDQLGGYKKNNKRLKKTTIKRKTPIKRKTTIKRKTKKTPIKIRQK